MYSDTFVLIAPDPAFILNLASSSRQALAAPVNQSNCQALAYLAVSRRRRRENLIVRVPIVGDVGHDCGFHPPVCQEAMDEVVVVP